MSLVQDFINNTEEAAVVVKGSNFDFENLYTRLILKIGTPSHVSFLTDYNRTVKLKLHWNPETLTMDICDDIYKLPCKKCNPSKEERERFKEANGRASTPTILRVAPVYCFDRVGVIKTSEHGTEYEEDPICLAELRTGKAEINFKTLLEANCEHPDFPNQYDFYKKVKLDNGSEVFELLPETLKNNYLMYDENGKDKIWQLRKEESGAGKKKMISYPEPRVISINKAKTNLGWDTLPKVPKDVRDFFDKQTIADILPFVLVHFGNVRWELTGVEPPKEGAKFGGTAKKTVNADSEL